MTFTAQELQKLITTYQTVWYLNGKNPADRWAGRECINLAEARYLPPQPPGSLPGIGVRESGLRCTACSGAIGGRMAGLEEVNRKLL